MSLDNTLKMPSLEKGLFNPDMFVILDDSNSIILDEYSKSDTIPTKTGYNFMGWGTGKISRK